MHEAVQRNDMSRCGATLLQYLLFAGFVAFLAAFLFKAETACAAAAIAKFSLVEGRVDVLKEGGLPAVNASVGDQVFNKDIVRTKSGSRAEISFFDGAVVKVGQRSRIDISEYAAEEAKGPRKLDLKRGKVQAIVPPVPVTKTGAASRASRFEINTPNAVAGVRGTDYVVLFENDITLVLVKEGTVTVVNPMFPDEVITVNAGEMCTVRFNEPPTKKEATEGEKLYLELALLSGKDNVFEGSGGYFGSVIIGTGLSALPPLYQSPPPPLSPPAVEVGRTTLSGSLVAGPLGQFDYISVMLKDVIFLAPSTGQPPALWNTDSISGSYRFGPDISNGVSSIPVSDGKGIIGNFNINQWGNNTWSGSTNGQGTLSGGSYNGPVNFDGNVSGTHGGGSSGSFSGSGSGRVH